MDGAGWYPVPWEEVVELIGGVSVGHSGEDVGEPCMRLDGVEFRGFDERGHGCPALASAIGAGEQMVLATERDRADGALDRIGIELDAAIVEEPGQAIPASERIADCLGKLAARGESGELTLQPCMQGIDQRS